MTTAATNSDQAKRTGMIAPLIVGAAGFMQTFDSSAITVALPPMAADFGVAALSLNLVITAYLIGATAFLPVCGWAADRFGARRIFLLAIAGFGLASLACALSTNLPMLIAARIVQGCMGALLIPVGRIIVMRAVPRNEVVKAASLLTLPVMFGPLLGPTIGGVLLSYGTWHLLFVLNVAMAALGYWSILKFIDDIPAEEPRPLDLKGYALVAMALVGVSYGISMAAQADANLLTPLALIAGGIVCGALYWRHCNAQQHPILDLRVLRLPTVYVTNVGGLFHRMLVSAGPFLLAMLFQLGFGLGPAATGGLIFAVALGSCFGRFIVTPFVRVIGFRNFLAFNSVALALSMAVCALFTPETPYAVIVAVLCVQGFLRSAQIIGMLSLSYAEISDRELGQVSTITSVSQQFALSIGIAISVIAIQSAQAVLGEADVTIGALAPAFIIVGALCLLPVFWLMRLPSDAGKHLINSKKD